MFLAYIVVEGLTLVVVILKKNERMRQDIYGKTLFENGFIKSIKDGKIMYYVMWKMAFVKNDKVCNGEPIVQCVFLRFVECPIQWVFLAQTLNKIKTSKPRYIIDSYVNT